MSNSLSKSQRQNLNPAVCLQQLFAPLHAQSDKEVETDGRGRMLAHKGWSGTFRQGWKVKGRCMWLRGMGCGSEGMVSPGGNISRGLRGLLWLCEEVSVTTFLHKHRHLHGGSTTISLCHPLLPDNCTQVLSFLDNCPQSTKEKELKKHSSGDRLIRPLNCMSFEHLYPWRQSEDSIPLG